MRCGVRSALLLATLGFIGAAQPPVVAPKPASVAKGTGCEACGILSLLQPRGRIVPVQDGPSLEPAGPTPEPLPLPGDAKPLPPGPDAPLDVLLEHYLPKATPQERNAWSEELRHLPPELARDILSARSKTEPPLSLPEELFLPSLPPQAEPPELPEPLRIARRGSETGPSGDATLNVLRQAESILLHNIANADTVGFKRSRPLFAEAAGSAGLAGVTAQRIEAQGELESTERSLDLAIDGPGFFQVRRGEVVGLTRGGTVLLNAQRELVLVIRGEEWALHPPVRIPPEAAPILVAETGAVGGHLASDDEPTQFGQLELARVDDPTRLDSVGGGLLAVPGRAGSVTTGIPGTPGFGQIRQGFLERSNVDLTAEMAALDRIRQQIKAFEPPEAPPVTTPSGQNSLRSAETPAPPSY